MSDIFISYAREDRARVASLAEALEGRGWSVWWDPHIPTGRRFDDVIEQAIAEARCMIVVWSGLSIKSDYVRAEAGEGAERGILFPVMLEEVRIPLPFRQLQTARLIDWRGEPRHPEFERLVRDLSALLGPPPASPPAEAEPPVRPS
ncbi:MAG TPA: toll/interleukin-1 receptor domain-containing protein, partial [Pyrinomonadaceae bacterium]|nr:toll/interleukin-1 receptor domain-containing protein [Pyrinomonadaceae bacterium]